MKEVEGLREETKEITCKCSNPDCPFNTQEVVEGRLDTFYDYYEGEGEEEESPDLGFGSMERLYRVQQISKQKNRRSLPPAPASTALRLLTPPETRRSLLSTVRSSTSLTNIPRGIQRRADGTIVENDYPGFYMGNKRSSKLTSGLSMSHLNRLDVIFNEALESDCQVDQDGLTNNEDYLFTREAPERKMMRTPRIGKKKTTLEYPMSITRHSSAGVILRQTSNPAKRNSLASIENSSDRLVNFLRSKNSTLARHSIIA